MKQVSIAEVLELPVQERVRLVELIWKSIAAIPAAVEVTPEVKAELQERLKQFEADPEAGIERLARRAPCTGAHLCADTDARRLHDPETLVGRLGCEESKGAS